MAKQLRICAADDGAVFPTKQEAEKYESMPDIPKAATHKVCDACKGTGRWSEGVCTNGKILYSTCLTCGGHGRTSHAILGQAIRDIAKDEWIVVECKLDGTITSDAIAFAEGTRWNDVLNCNR